MNPGDAQPANPDACQQAQTRVHLGNEWCRVTRTKQRARIAGDRAQFDQLAAQVAELETAIHQAVCQCRPRRKRK